MFNNLLLFRRTRVKGYYQKRVAGTAADGGERDAKRSTSVSKLPQRGALHRNWAQYSQVGLTGCNLPCSGNASEICGGSLRLSVYNLTTYVPPTTVKSVGTYVSKGCYKEATTGRLFNGAAYTNATAMTVESCVAFCSSQKTPQQYAGVEFGQECFCSNTLPTSAVSATPDKCDMPCPGNKKEFCGAGGSLGVYYNDPNAVVPAAMKRAVRRV